MSPQESRDIRAWQRRWREINKRRVAEILSKSPEEKACEVSVMMSTQVSPEWAKKREAEVEEVRRRWATLREFYGCIE